MLIPLRDLVYIIPLEDREKVGSIYVPDQAKQRVDQGIVKYRGPDVKELRVGDHVIFSGYSGDELITETDGLLYLMREDDILAVFGESDSRVMTEGQVRSMITRTLGDLRARGAVTPKVASIIEEHFTHRIDNLLAEELHF